MRTRTKRLLPLLAMLGVLAPAAAFAQSAADEPLRGGVDDPAVRSGVIRVDAGEGASQSIDLTTGKSASIDLPVDARDILVTNPKIASAVLRSPRRITVMGTGPGETDAVFYDAAGRQILSLDIRVKNDFGVLAQTVNRLLPGSSVHMDWLGTSVVLSGRVANLADADKAVRIAQQYTTKPTDVINMLTIAGKDQVMLKVRIIEVQRSVIKQLGFNLSATLNQLGSPQFLISSAATYGVNGALLGGATGTIQSNGGNNKSTSTLEAFEQVGMVRTLDEETLTTTSGEAAKFLAGGEFPVPVGSGLTGITIDFKPYGVGLGFTPIVLSDGRISLKLSTEVSQLSSQGEISLSTGASSTSTTSSTSSAASTVAVPSLIVRRADTVVELPSGGAMMIAGLLQEQTQQNIASLPGLMNLPILGTLFNSRDFQQGQTELVIIVTPYIVSPTSPDKLQTPADGLRVASDPETVLLGRLNKAYSAPPTADAAAQNYQGPAGYVIE